MKGQLFADFMRLRGRRIIEGAGKLWYSTSLGIYMSIPFHEPFDLSEAELAELLRRNRILGVRFPSIHRAGLPSGMYYCRPTNYNLSSVHTKQRNRTRRSLEQCEVRPVEREQLLVEGLQCNLDTMARQNRFDSEFGDPRKWRRLVDAVGKSPGVGVTGAFVNDRLAAYVISCREDGWLQLLHQMSSRELLDYSPNNALTFTVTKAAEEDPAIEAVCYGVAGLSSGPGLHEYKLRLGYQMQSQNSVFLLRPGFETLLSSAAVLNGIGLLRRMRPSNQRIERVESVLTGARLARLGPQVQLAPTLQ
jgi:Acetyltransferase (GNAT) domain